MKKISIVAFAVSALGIASCKKDRTCECTTQTISQTSTQPGYSYTPPPASKTSSKYNKVKKSNPLVQQCVSGETTRTYITTAYNGTTAAQYEVTSVTKNDCSIK